MKELLSFIILFCVLPVNFAQIIADHHAVNDYDKIPANYLSEVKKMMIYIAGASHSEAYRKGLTLLEESNPFYAVNVSNDESYTSSYLRANTGSSYMQEGPWFCWYAYPEGSRPAWSNTVVNLIQNYHNNKRNLRVIGFGWCWDMAGGYPSTGWDPLYGCRWWGSSVDGPDGDTGWGLDVSDYSLTGNRVSLQTYLDAVEFYRDYCRTNNIAETDVIYTTAPLVASLLGAEACWSGQIKHNAIREWVSSEKTRILLDYADILAYDNNDTQYTGNYDGHTYQVIAPDNLLPEQTGHISNIGAVRLAKAQWWLLARVAGWDGITTNIDNNTITSSSPLEIQRFGSEIIIKVDEFFINSVLNVYDLNSRLIKTYKISDDHLLLNSSILRPGIYIIELSKHGISKAKKFIIS